MRSSSTPSDRDRLDEVLLAIARLSRSKEDAQAQARGLSAMLAGDAELAPLATLLEELAEHTESRRRQIARFGYDLHDGALQEIAALGTELHLFRDQMADTLAGHESEPQLLGRVDDVVARLVDLDTSLRELAVSAESSTLVWRPLTVSVREAVEVYANKRPKIELELDERLDTADLSPSQRIALVRIVQGAVANVVQHSGAQNARVRLTCSRYGVSAQISDDGKGFVVQPTLRRAAELGRIGLVSMRERVRLLGGEFTVKSKPGGPTSIQLRLPTRRNAGPGASQPRQERQPRRRRVPGKAD